VLSTTAYCSTSCRIKREAGELTWTHRMPCSRCEGDPIVDPLSPEPPPSKLKKICCPYCDASTHIVFDDCWDCNKKFPPPPNTTNRPPISSTMSILRSDRMDQNSEEGSRLSGYDRPRTTRGRNTDCMGGDRGRIPRRGGNSAGGEDPCHSGSSSIS